MTATSATGSLIGRGRELERRPHRSPDLLGGDPGVEGLVRGAAAEGTDDVVARPVPGVRRPERLLHPRPELGVPHPRPLTRGSPARRARSRRAAPVTGAPRSTSQPASSSTARSGSSRQNVKWRGPPTLPWVENRAPSPSLTARWSAPPGTGGAGEPGAARSGGPRAGRAAGTPRPTRRRTARRARGRRGRRPAGRARRPRTRRRAASGRRPAVMSVRRTDRPASSSARASRPGPLPTSSTRAPASSAATNRSIAARTSSGISCVPARVVLREGVVGRDRDPLGDVGDVVGVVDEVVEVVAGEACRR